MWRSRSPLYTHYVALFRSTRFAHFCNATKSKLSEIEHLFAKMLANLMINICQKILISANRWSHVCIFFVIFHLFCFRNVWQFVFYDHIFYFDMLVSWEYYCYVLFLVFLFWILSTCYIVVTTCILIVWLSQSPFYQPVPERHCKNIRKRCNGSASGSGGDTKGTLLNESTRPSSGGLVGNSCSLWHSWVSIHYFKF